MKEFEHRVRSRILKEFQSDDEEFIAQIIFHDELEGSFEVVLMDFCFNPEGDIWRNRFSDYSEAYSFAVESTEKYEHA